MQEMRVKVNQIELQIREYEQEGDAIIFLHFSGALLNESRQQAQFIAGSRCGAYATR